MSRPASRRGTLARRRPSEAAYVNQLRVYVTDPSTIDNATRIYDFQARNGQGGTNVAAGRPVTVSGTCNAATENGDRLVDGSTSTKWCDNTGAAGVGQAWAIIDLAGLLPVDRFTFLHAGVEAAGHITVDYRVEGRASPLEPWVVLVNVTGNTNNNPTHVLATVEGRWTDLWTDLWGTTAEGTWPAKWPAKWGG